ncbi:MAG: acyl-CoA synthetase [Lysobacteraceae bacterium]|nr:MAG: acyl-CoA synthetase [Xanthomonadaceae bacterium]
MTGDVDTNPPSRPVVTGNIALAEGPAGRAIAFDRRGQIRLEVFLAEVRGVAAGLPDAAHAVILCEDRYRFLVAFCAVGLRGQIALLPPSRTPAVIAEVRAQYPDSYCISDVAMSPAPPRLHALPERLPRLEGVMPLVDTAAVAMIGFTSGSTGAPCAHPKTWGSLRISNAQNLAAIRHLWPAAQSARIVATVPPQHMYGMELSVLLPLLSDAAVHGARPLFPEDVARALHDADTPVLLVTTPVHLRALVESGITLPPIAGIVTATAPLPQSLAATAEQHFGCEVREMFGATETCVIAERRTARDTFWRPYPGVQLHPQADGTLVSAAHLPAPVLLADLIESRHDGRFLLRGRQADLLEIAGKRASLGDLTRRLLAIPGVVDGAMFQLEEGDAGGVRRIAAVAVAPTLDEATILDALRQSIDPAFLPRRLRLVGAMPRNDTGKLPRAELLRLLG